MLPVALPRPTSRISRPAADGSIAANYPTALAAGDDPQGRLQALVGGAARIAFAEAWPFWPPMPSIDGSLSARLRSPSRLPSGRSVFRRQVSILAVIHAGDATAPFAIRSRWPICAAMGLIHGGVLNSPQRPDANAKLTGSRAVAR